MGLLDAFQLGEALRLPFLHADLFLGELRGEAFGLGLFGECLALCDGEAAAQELSALVHIAIGCKPSTNSRQTKALQVTDGFGDRDCLRLAATVRS